jgi:hypothetical protein
MIAVLMGMVAGSGIHYFIPEINGYTCTLCTYLSPRLYIVLLSLF